MSFTRIKCAYIKHIFYQSIDNQGHCLNTAVALAKWIILDTLVLNTWHLFKLCWYFISECLLHCFLLFYYLCYYFYFVLFLRLCLYVSVLWPYNMWFLYIQYKFGCLRRITLTNAEISGSICMANIHFSREFGCSLIVYVYLCVHCTLKSGFFS